MFQFKVQAKCKLIHMSCFSAVLSGIYGILLGKYACTVVFTHEPLGCVRSPSNGCVYHIHTEQERMFITCSPADNE